jgi:hypothetical protein
LKRLLLIAPLAATTAACATEDLEAFSYGLSQLSYELDNQMNPPCPNGMYRAFVSDTLATTYPQYSYQQIGYNMHPGGYSYCAFQGTTPYYSDDDRRGDHHGGRDRPGEDAGYSDGYRDGYRDGQRDD